MMHLQEVRRFLLDEDWKKGQALHGVSIILFQVFSLGEGYPILGHPQHLKVLHQILDRIGVQIR